MDGCMYVQMNDECMIYIQMHGWVGGWVGWMDGWMNEWMLLFMKNSFLVA